MRLSLVATALLFSVNFACQGDGLPATISGNAGTTGTGGGSAGTGAGGSTTGGATTAVFQYDGSLLLALTVVDRRRVEISAPIVPRTSVIYAAFPTTLEGEQAMAHEAALLFDWLLPQCAPLYPKIRLAPADGTPLSPEQLAMNYDQVGQCAYEQYVAKPYWIPRLVGDVDICGTEMGAGWRLITEADLTSLSEADLQAVADTWNPHPSGTSSGLGFFFSTPAIWVRAADGTIAAGTLAPGVTGSRVTPLGVAPDSTTHYEGSLGLRCIRRTETLP